MSSSNQNTRRKSRQNARSTQFAQRRAEQRRNQQGPTSSPAPPRIRTEWERRGPADLDVLQFAHSWVCKSESTLIATANDTWYTVDLHNYVSDQAEFPTKIRGFVILFEAEISGSFCLVQKKNSSGLFRDEFSSLNSFKFEKGQRYGVQLLAPEGTTFSSLKEGIVAFVLKFDSSTTKDAPFLTRKVWGQSDRLPEIIVPGNLLRG